MTDTNASALSADAQAILGAVGTVLGALVPGGVIAGVTISTITSIAQGVVQGVPEIVTAYEDIKAAIDGGAPPSEAQLLALKAAVDAADDKLQKAAK